MGHGDHHTSPIVRMFRSRPRWQQKLFPFICITSVLLFLYSSQQSRTTFILSRFRPRVNLAQVNEERRAGVREAIQFTYENYEKLAMGADEFAPISGKRKDKIWGGVHTQLIESLSTLWLAGFKKEFWRARDFIIENMTVEHWKEDSSISVSVAEINARVVGGLLSAHSLSGERGFLYKAQEVMNLMKPAFQTDRGIFYSRVTPAKKTAAYSPFLDNLAPLADIGTLQLELRYLTDETEVISYGQMGDAFYDFLRHHPPDNTTNLYPGYYNPHTNDWALSSLHMDASTDSFYEYLLKVYLYSGKRQEDQFLRDMYDRSVEAMEDHLLVYSEPDDLFYMHTLAYPHYNVSDNMDHRSCLLPGMLALGSLHEVDPLKNKRHLSLAQRLGETCYHMHHRQRTGLSPDVATFPGITPIRTRHQLRPETAESLFYLYRATGDAKYRDWGWDIFQSLNTSARTSFGYAVVKDVTQMPPDLGNAMETSILAATLPYLYLLFAPEETIDLQTFVFNTQGHPLRIQST